MHLLSPGEVVFPANIIISHPEKFPTQTSRFFWGGDWYTTVYLTISIIIPLEGQWKSCKRIEWLLGWSAFWMDAGTETGMESRPCGVVVATKTQQFETWSRVIFHFSASRRQTLPVPVHYGKKGKWICSRCGVHRCHILVNLQEASNMKRAHQFLRIYSLLYRTKHKVLYWRL